MIFQCFFVLVQFYDRLLMVVMPVKYQPDYIYLRHVKLLRIHLFTLIQFICFVVMWVIKTVKETSITFPVMVSVVYLGQPTSFSQVLLCASK